jgi:ubiquinol oxidase
MFLALRARRVAAWLLGAALVSSSCAFTPSYSCWTARSLARRTDGFPDRGVRGLRVKAQDSDSGDGVCSAARPRLDPGESPRLNSIFHERTEGTRWSGPVPRQAGGLGGLFSGPRWADNGGGGGRDAGRRPVESLDPVTKGLASALVWALKEGLDVLYEERPDFARFFVLETVARVPYFAYISVLHLYESLGRHNRAAWMKVHFAEADNELHHLLIMEALGGNKNFADRWFAQHSALAYYWACIVLYLVHPRAAYHVMSLIEDHAYRTYDKYVKCNEEWLKTQPAPAIAKQYYESDDRYLFDLIHTAADRRRPSISTLYDTFVNIREDEKQHATTMKCLVDHGRLSPPPPAPREFGSRMVK